MNKDQLLWLLINCFSIFSSLNVNIFEDFLLFFVINGSKWRVFKLSAGQIEDATLGSAKLWWVFATNLDITQQISDRLMNCGNNLQIKLYNTDEKSSQIRKKECTVMKSISENRNGNALKSHTLPPEVDSNVGDDYTTAWLGRQNPIQCKRHVRHGRLYRHFISGSSISVSENILCMTKHMVKPFSFGKTEINASWMRGEMSSSPVAYNTALILR